MFYKVYLDMFCDTDENENPVFYLKEDEYKFFMDICLKNNFRVIVESINEEEYLNEFR